VSKPSLKRGPRCGPSDEPRSPHKSGPRGGSPSTVQPVTIVEVAAAVVTPIVEVQAIVDIINQEPASIVESVIVADSVPVATVAQGTVSTAEQKNKKKTI